MGKQGPWVSILTWVAGWECWVPSPAQVSFPGLSREPTATETQRGAS